MIDKEKDIYNIDKSKLVFRQSDDSHLKDQPLQTKRIGYYRDSWIRFKKNKASVVAFAIILIIILFVIIGPYLRGYDLPNENPALASKFQTIRPRLPGFKNAPIFNGRIEVSYSKDFLKKAYSIDPKMFVTKVDEHTFDYNPNPTPEQKKQNPDIDKSILAITFDDYRLANYRNSYYTQDTDYINNSAPVITYISQQQLDEALKNNELINISDYRISNKMLYTYTKIENSKISAEEQDKYFSKLPENIVTLFNENKPYTIEGIEHSNNLDQTIKLFSTLVEKKLVKQESKVESSDKYYQVRLDLFKRALNAPPDKVNFWFGTTTEGRDLFTDLWIGARISLILATIVLIINSTIGLIIGAYIGYYGGYVDLIFDRIVEIIAAIPFLAVLTLLSLRYGQGGMPYWVIVFAFTATGWIGSYGTGRFQFYRFKNREYVLAAKTLGASDRRIIFKHIFPNTLGYIVTGLAIAIPSFVFTEATFAFLKILKFRGASSVGLLIQEGQSLIATQPYLLLFPAIYISILMIAFNLFGNGLRDAFNPSLRGSE